MIEEQARWQVFPETMLPGDRETLRRAVGFFQLVFKDFEKFRGYYLNMRSPVRLVAQAFLEDILPAMEKQEFACLMSLSGDFQEGARALPLAFDFPRPDGSLAIAHLLIVDGYRAELCLRGYWQKRRPRTPQDQLMAELIDPFEKGIKLMASLVGYSGTKGLPFAKREEIITFAQKETPTLFSHPVAWF